MKHTCGIDGDAGALMPLDGKCLACERLREQLSTTDGLNPPDNKLLSLVAFEYIHKISRQICPRLDHEEIAMDLWCKCWQEKTMPTYVRVKNHCLDALRKEKGEKKKHGELVFHLGKIAFTSELPEDLLDILIQRAKLTTSEMDVLHLRYYQGQSLTNGQDEKQFESAVSRLQQAWKEYQDELER